MDEGVDLEYTCKYWESVCEEVANKQLTYDKKVQEEYMRRENLAEHDVRFIFEPGDPVLMK